MFPPSIRPSRIDWIRQPLLINSQTEDECVTYDVLVFFRNGTVVVADRAFGRFDAIDYPFPGGKALREKGSNILVIYGADGNRYFFQYRSFLYLFFRGWYRLVVRTVR